MTGIAMTQSDIAAAVELAQGIIASNPFFRDTRMVRLANALLALSDREKRLVGALQFYADDHQGYSVCDISEVGIDYAMSDEPTHEYGEVIRDRGKRVRALLKELGVEVKT